MTRRATFLANVSMLEIKPPTAVDRVAVQVARLQQTHHRVDLLARELVAHRAQPRHLAVRVAVVLVVRVRGAAVRVLARRQRRGQLLVVRVLVVSESAPGSSRAAPTSSSSLSAMEASPRAPTSLSEYMPK